WLEIVQIALDLLAWMPMLALTGKARLWEPRRLRFRLFTAAVQLLTTGRRRTRRSRLTTAALREVALQRPADAWVGQ
ncbi:IS1380 family transposase, partial [Streptomyces sp. NPDC055105]